MRKLILLLCFGIISSIAGNPYNEKALYIEFKPPIEPFKALSYAVSMVESSGDKMAYNAKEQATGLHQVRPIRLRDFNRRTGKSYKINDMYDPDKSKEVFLYYCCMNLYKGQEYTCREWNGGTGAVKKRSTKEYYKKVLKYLELS